jgi:hypothetical protein
MALMEIQRVLMRHCCLKNNAEIYGIEPDVASTHRDATTSLVRMLLGKQNKLLVPNCTRGFVSGL